MKPGDKVSFNPLVPVAYVEKIEGEDAAIWWPCPEFGRHTRIVPKGALVILDDKGSEDRHAKRPKRTKDHHLDGQVCRPTQLPDPA